MKDLTVKYLKQETGKKTLVGWDWGGEGGMNLERVFIV